MDLACLGFARMAPTCMRENMPHVYSSSRPRLAAHAKSQTRTPNKKSKFADSSAHARLSANGAPLRLSTPEKKYMLSTHASTIAGQPAKALATSVTCAGMLSATQGRATRPKSSATATRARTSA